MNEQNRRTTDDVRMRGFARRQTVESALAWLDAQLQPLDPEPVALRMAAGRVLAESITSDVDVPGFDRATMDGYALVAESTEGATSYNRLPLTVIGDSMPGRPFPASVGAGQAVRIMTGAPMPQGCDAVLPAEWVEARKRHRRLSHSPLSRLEKMSAAAERTSPGGRRCLPRTRAAPAGSGRAQFRRCWRGARLSPAACPAGGDRQRAAAVGLAAAGTLQSPTPTGRCSRRSSSATEGSSTSPAWSATNTTPSSKRCHADADVVIVSGGSSVGIEDLAPMLVAQTWRTGRSRNRHAAEQSDRLGRIEHRLVFLLPGNPVSSLCAYDFFAGRAIRALGGRSQDVAVPLDPRETDSQDQFADRPPRLRPRADR